MSTVTEKENPDRLELRAKPRPVVRLNRRLISVLAGAILLAVVLALMWGLRKPEPSRSQPPQEKRNIERVTRAEGLESLPRDYAAIPKPLQLGAPIGELGRPVLRAEREAGIPVLPERPTYRPNPEEDAIRAQRLREQSEAEAAGKAAVLMALQRHAGASNSSLNVSTDASDRNTIERSGVGLPTPTSPEPNQQDRKRSFLEKEDSRISASADLQIPRSPYQLTGGIAAIPAALVTGINSDLPGDISATVTENVYDTTTGEHLLIPQGSWLHGQYDSQVAYGQRRVLMVWTRLTLPNGDSIALDRLKGVDASGYAGLEDRVDWHWSRIFAGAAVSTLLGAGAELASPRQASAEGTVVISTREGVQDTINQVGQEITRRNLDIQPTLTVRPGFPLRVVVNRDLVLRPYTG
jgi:type IV secretion system protein VirB10